MSSPLLEHPNVPKYVKLAERIKHQMAEGELKPGDRLPSFAVMREQYGVGQGTLERVHGLLEQEGLIVRMPGKGVFLCEQQTRARTGLIGCLTVGYRAAEGMLYWLNLMQGMQDAAHGGGYEIVLLDPDQLNRGLARVDGLLVSGPEENTMSGLPTVSVVQKIAGLPCVVADDYLGARLATEHLLALGHRRIGYLFDGEDSGESIAAHRLRGYRDALRAAGVKPNARWQRWLRTGAVDIAGFVELGQHSMSGWLQDEWPTLGCTALLAQNDETAVGAMRSLMVAGLRVPDDISVVGFDGTPASDQANPRLTTVEVPLRAIGARAVEILLAQLETGLAPSEVTVLPVRLRVADSTAASPQLSNKR